MRYIRYIKTAKTERAVGKAAKTVPAALDAWMSSAGAFSALPARVGHCITAPSPAEMRGGRQRSRLGPQVKFLCRPDGV